MPHGRRFVTEAFGEAELRHWLVDYLVTNIGLSPDEIDFDGPLNDLGVGSRDSVVLSGELSELLGRPVSPVEFWQHPTINDLARFLTGSEPDAAEEASTHSERSPLDEPIAVIGLGCRIPGDVGDPDALWTLLAEGRSAVSQVPPQRWESFSGVSAEADSILASTTHWGSFLDDIEGFDAGFFDISSREAAKMDPQQRLLLEVAWEALEHSGIAPSSLRHSQTGVFVGASLTEYGYLGSTDLSSVDAWSNTGGALSIIANRLSYQLDLRGPSLTVDTACSSSLVALHLACQSLRMGDSNVALAAGVNLLLLPAVFYGLDQAGALSPTGACHSFDAAADGFVRGEGCGVAVLKRLSDALEDGDRILAVVRGSAVNQDGRSNGLMAPNPAAQMAVLRSAYASAGVAPQEVDYVETHGTGTLLGDPIEARALGTVLGRGRPAKAPLLIGALKSNIGHLEAAAGIAGFIKAVLAVQRGTIPANHGFTTPNPHISFEQMRLKVVAEEQKWPDTGRPRRAGVSSFGFGGTNAHVVIEQAPEAVPAEHFPEPAVTTLIVSAKTPERVATTAQGLADWMSGAGAGVALPEVAHTLNHHRERHHAFATVSARDHTAAVDGLRALADGRSAAGVVAPHDGSCDPGRVFVYSGQGSQWTGMAHRLLRDEPRFASAIEALEPAFVEEVGFSLATVLRDREEVVGDARVQPVVMGLQLALTDLWRSYGVTPDAVIGHSMGEVTAAVVAGALTVREGFRVIAHRSRVMSQLAGQGAVALLGLDAAAAEDLLSDIPGVSIAGYVSPRQTVVAGPPAAVDRAIAAASGQNRFARRVNMEVASHTAMMDPVLPELRSALAGIHPEIAAIPFYSTVEDPATTNPLLDVEYWVANVRQPARFLQAVEHAAAHFGTFIEISPHPILTHAMAETVEGAHRHCVGTLARDEDDTIAFHTSLNSVFISQPPPTPHPPEPHPVLPHTPWHHQPFWLDVRRSAALAPRGGDTDGEYRAVDGPVPAEWYSEVAWPTRDAPASSASGPQTWLVVGSPGLGAAIEDALGNGGRVDVVAAPAANGSGADALTAALASATYVLYAPEPGGSAPDDVAAAYDVFNTARRIYAAMATADAATPPRLVLLTRNGQAVLPGDRTRPVDATLWGFGRTLALETPQLWGGVIDVDETVPAIVVARYLVGEVHGDDTEDQVAYRAGRRHVPRLRCRTLPSEQTTLTDGTSHLVVGATGNIGPHLITQLADMGATSILAVSRNPGTRLDELTSRLAGRGVTLTTVAADATDEAAMREVFARFGADLPPLAGIHLAAFGGGPAQLSDMRDEDVAAMFRPKLDALAVLHTLSLRVPDLEHFVLFSSISGLTGSRWLAHYAATTTFLDAFAAARRAAGLPATTVNWGLWKSLSDNQTDEERQVTTGSGLEPMADEVAIRALSVLMGADGPTNAVVAAADWPTLAAAYRTRAALRIVDDMVQTPGAADGSAPASTPFRDELRACEPERRRDLLTRHVTEQVAAAMGLASPRLLDPAVGFFQSGMDSLMSVTLQRALSESLGEPLSAAVVFDYPTVDALTEHLASLLPELVEADEADTTDDYDDLSDEELLKQLTERLG